MRCLALAFVIVAGCETGTEIAGVSQAAVEHGPDGRTIVTATLDCMLAHGMPRADGNCDADDSKICVEAMWVVGNTGSARPAKQCQRIAHVRGATVRLVLADPPDGAQAIVVYTTAQHLAKEPALQHGVTVSR